ncbi:MAG: hypothetical protein CMJ58_03730 [Planctomycetaceae bacterium]|nr:hypothetical protein [Planctomycetaceae bacterium]
MPVFATKSRPVAPAKPPKSAKPAPAAKPPVTQVRQLARLLERWSAPPDGGEVEVVPSGAPPLDAALADGGFRRGWLVEWLAAGRGAGAGALALLAAREACRTGGALVIIDRGGTFYPPALAAWGVDLSRTIVALPATPRDEAWAIDQALRCPHTAAVLATPRSVDGRNFRRWQLAAEATGALGLLLRPAAARSEPTWAVVRMQVTPHGAQPLFPVATGLPLSAAWRLQIELLRSRGRLHARTLQVELDSRTGSCHETNTRRVVAELAAAAPGHQTA